MRSSSSRRACLALVSIAAWSALLAPAAARAGTANAGLPGAPAGNPLAGMPWGLYTGPIDNVYGAYAAAHGRPRSLLAKIALRPLAYWFGGWYDDSYAETVAREYIDNVTGGQGNVLVQAVVFRLDPWEGGACTTLPSPAQQAGYRRWINGFAAGVGTSRVALILQPDLPFALCSPNRSRLPLQMVAYAARRFSSLAHTTVYIDAGAAEWASVPQAAWLLQQAGIRYTRGFALNATQYDSTGNELQFGARITVALGALHLRRRHFVINTDENGAPFLAGQYPGDSNNPRVCANSRDRICATLGIPPTTNTASARWGLSPAERGIAARQADAYLWIGRPWLDNNTYPFDLQRALGLASSTPF